jgi:HEPN domain-containing protein
MPPDKSIPGSVQDWLVRAKGHLALAKQPKPEGAFWEDQCFLAQQAAEKALKAVYQHRGLLFRYTHDLENWAKVWKTMAYPYHPSSKKLSY